MATGEAQARQGRRSVLELLWFTEPSLTTPAPWLPVSRAPAGQRRAPRWLLLRYDLRPSAEPKRSGRAPARRLQQAAGSRRRRRGPWRPRTRGRGGWRRRGDEGWAPVIQRLDLLCRGLVELRFGLIGKLSNESKTSDPRRIRLGMAVGRVRVGCCIHAPEPETRTLNPTRTRTCNWVEYYPRTRTRRGPETRWVTRDPKNRNT
jgi:hypothetical protein